MSGGRAPTRRPSWLLLLIAAWMLACPPQVTAMGFHAAPPILYLGGAVMPNDWNAWNEAMARYGDAIKTVVFHESSGGDSRAGRRIGDDIRARGLGTAVYGRCMSACANMFLGGVTRQFAMRSLRIEHVLGYHGSYNKRTKELNRNRTADYFVRLTDGKMDETFVERFIKIQNKSGLMRFFHRDQRRQNETLLAQLCLGSEERAKLDEQCERLDGIDALSKGVITTWDTFDVGTVPAPPKTKTTLTSWEKPEKAATTPPPVLTTPDFNQQ